MLKQKSITLFAEGNMILSVILGVVYYVMKYQAEKPLIQLTNAAEAIGRGEYKSVAQQTIEPPLK